MNRRTFLINRRERNITEQGWNNWKKNEHTTNNPAGDPCSRTRNKQFQIKIITPCLGFPPEFRFKFFPFPLWKRFRKTGIPERFREQFLHM